MIDIPDDLEEVGLRSDEVVCPVCNLTFYFRLADCPSCAAGLT